MHHFTSLPELTWTQLQQYREALKTAFPRVIRSSAVIAEYWERLERYFPTFQFCLVAGDGNLIGFMNAIPFRFNDPLDGLPDAGWDWMFTQGIADHEAGVKPNFLGSLQVVVRPEHQRMGHSKRLLKHAKHTVETTPLRQVVIPIRRTKKYLFPTLSMADYLKLRDSEEIYDPWVRTHLRGGAKIIRVCRKSMTVAGDLSFWEDLLDRPVTTSGEYTLPGGLRPVVVDTQRGGGVYEEPNVWVAYPANKM